MKPFFVLVCCCICACTLAQTTDTLRPVFNVPGRVNITVYTTNNNSITGQVWKYSDSNLIMYGQNNAGNVVLMHIGYEEISTVHIQRSNFFQDMAVGMMIGATAGTYIISPNYTDYLTPGTVIGSAAGTAVAGINYVVKKKDFNINGSRRKFQKLYKTLNNIQHKKDNR